MPVEDIHLVFGQLVDIFLYFLFGEPVAADVQHQSAPGKLRFVGDVGAWDRPVEAFLFPVALYLWGKHLQQGLHTVEDSGRLVCGNDDVAVFDQQVIAFCSECRIVCQLEFDVPVFLNRYFETGGGSCLTVQVMRDLQQFRIGRVERDCGTACKAEKIILYCNLLRSGNQSRFILICYSLFVGTGNEA